MHTQSAASIYRLLTRDIPRCCDGLAVLQTHHFVPEKNKKVKRRVLAKMISRLYRERETAPTYLSEFASVFESLGFDQELGKNVDIEEHFWTVLNDKKRDLNMLNELLLGAGFKEAIFFESAVNELDIESYCTGVFFSRELAPALKRAMMQV